MSSLLDTMAQALYGDLEVVRQQIAILVHLFLLLMPQIVMSVSALHLLPISSMSPEMLVSMDGSVRQATRDGIVKPMVDDGI